jgi:hypothetical protein
MLHELTSPIIVLHAIFPQGDPFDALLVGKCELSCDRLSMRFLLKKSVQLRVSL